jgi:hypothetical protein
LSTERIWNQAIGAKPPGTLRTIPISTLPHRYTMGTETFLVPKSLDLDFCESLSTQLVAQLSKLNQDTRHPQKSDALFPMYQHKNLAACFLARMLQAGSASTRRGNRAELAPLNGYY